MSSTPGKNTAVSRWFGFDTIDADRFVTSYFISPTTLLCIRSFITLYITWGLAFHLYITYLSGTIKLTYTYFTNLTYIGLWGYYVSSLVHTVLYVIRHNNTSFTDYFYITASHWVLYHTIIVSNVLTPVVFWSLLSGPLISSHSSPQVWYTNINVHGLTLIWMLTDVFLTRQRITWRVFLFDLLMIILFVFEAWLTHAVDGIWVYSFLSLSQGPIAAAWYIGVAAFVVVIFALQRYIIHPLRDWLGKKYGRYYNQYSETSEPFEANASQKEHIATEKSGDNAV